MVSPKILQQTGKKQATKKAMPKKPADKKKKAIDKWAWKSKPPKDTDTKEMMHSSKPLKTRSTFGALTITMVQACGHSTIRRIVKATQVPAAHQPTPTSLHLTPWTATLTRNDCCTRVKSLLGSGLQSPATSSGCCSQMTWE